jgi:hypothetical protein
MLPSSLLKRIDHLHGSRRSTYAHDRADPASGVHDRENPQTAAIEQLIMHPVHRPYLIGSRRIASIIPQFGHDASAWRFKPHLQPLQPMEPMHALDVDIRVSAISRIRFLRGACSGRRER